ncbi:MAG TPA: DUF4395 domain-containing protein [Acidimicrobiales bacterium]|nr:DUF4395 domain-containing protein [Acidimicrobiales bacterium]
MTAPPGTAVRRPLLSFPDPVNEVAARLVAAGVVIMAVVAVAFDARWLTVVMAYGFIARVATGPRLSPLGLVVTRVVVPRLPVEPRFVPGPPKRFAQGIGAVVTTTAAVLAFVGDAWPAARVLLVLISVAAFLEAALAFCVACKVFALLMRVGVIPESACEQCSDLRTGGRAAA